MPEVRAKISFVDKTGRVRNAGDEFYCDDERAGSLVSRGFAEVIGVPFEEEPEAEPEPEQEEEPEAQAEAAPKRTRKKKAAE